MRTEDVYDELDLEEMEMPFPMERREFLKIAAGGIGILFSWGAAPALAQRGRPSAPADFNAYLLIGEDGRVTCFTGKVELGQGVVTSLAQMLAEELDVSLDTVDMVMGDTDRCPWDRGTHGSMSIRFFGPPLRAAGAAARGVLLELAAEHLQVSQDRLEAKDGVISERGKPHTQVTYAQLAKGQKITRQLEHEAPLKKPSEFTVIGKPVKRTDALEKVTGRAQYAGDIRLPGMLYARILRPPAHGATLKQIDASAAESIEGVQVVRDGDLVAVLHKYPDVADEALSKLKADFDVPPANVDEGSIYDHLLAVAPEGSAEAEGGDLKTGKEQSAFTFEHTYLNAYVAHAPIEPHTAVANIEGNRITVWASTQSPFGLKSSIVSSLGVSEDDVHVLTPYVGGGFGGKNFNQQGVEAARLAKLTGKPIHLAWSRKEEFFYDPFRPAAVIKITSGVNKSGEITLWDYHVYFAGSRGAEHFYAIPHHRTVVHGSNWTRIPGSHPFGTGPWRAPSNNSNTFARESQVDIMAAKAEMDALEFRLKNLTDQRMRGVLQATAGKFGWSPSKAPSGRGFGIACGIDSGTYVALMAEVAVDKNTGQVSVKRVVCAQDMGLVINPEGAKLQVEGCITMGLGYALAEEIHFKGGEILDLNFDTYKIPRFSWLPEIETVLIDAKDSPAQGGGEPAIICMGGVIANAIYDAVGARLWHLPMTPERIKTAM